MNADEIANKFPASLRVAAGSVSLITAIKRTFCGLISLKTQESGAPDTNSNV